MPYIDLDKMDELRREWTDRLVTARPDRPELQRFAGKIGRVITVNYSGTNPQHTFSLQWGSCQDVPGSDVHQVAVEVLDNQWRDEARQAFSKTIRFSLDGIPCRPAKLTLRIAPRFITTLMIPAGNDASN